MERRSEIQPDPKSHPSMRHCSGRGKETVAGRLLRRGQRDSAAAKRNIIKIDKVRSKAKDAHIQRVRDFKRRTQPDALSDSPFTCNVQVELPKLRAVAGITTEGPRTSDRCQAETICYLGRERRGGVDAPVNVVRIAREAWPVVAHVVQVAVDPAGRKIERCARTPPKERRDAGLTQPPRRIDGRRERNAVGAVGKAA